MTPHTPVDDWDSLQQEWQSAGGSAASRASTAAGLARARRALFVVPLLEGAIAVAALSVTAAALLHAAGPAELFIGLVVAGAIVLAWVQRAATRRSEHGAAAAGSSEYMNFLRGVRMQQVRLATFIQLVLVLELAFLTPWWVRGNRVHHRTPLSAAAWTDVYLPALLMAVLFIWADRVRRRAGKDAALLGRAIDEYRREP